MKSLFKELQTWTLQKLFRINSHFIPKLKYFFFTMSFLCTLRVKQKRISWIKLQSITMTKIEFDNALYKFGGELFLLWNHHLQLGLTKKPTSHLFSHSSIFNRLKKDFCHYPAETNEFRFSKRWSFFSKRRLCKKMIERIHCLGSLKQTGFLSSWRDPQCGQSFDTWASFNATKQIFCKPHRVAGRALASARDGNEAWDLRVAGLKLCRCLDPNIDGISNLNKFKLLCKMSMKFVEQRNAKLQKWGSVLGFINPGIQIWSDIIDFFDFISFKWVTSDVGHNIGASGLRPRGGLGMESGSFLAWQELSTCWMAEIGTPRPLHHPEPLFAAVRNLNNVEILLIGPTSKVWNWDSLVLPQG